MTQYISIKNLSKKYSDSKNSDTIIFEDFSLSIEKEEILTIFGPNGCGKTTLLLMIAGLYNFENGSININNKAPGDINIGVVFQNYERSLFPWLPVIDNIAFPLRQKISSKMKRRERVEAFIDKMDIKNLQPHLYSYPYQLSGGLAQFTAIARALINESEIICMDEPFASLDYEQRNKMQDELIKLWKKSKATMIFISHEIDEALYLGHRLLLLGRKPVRVLKDIPINYEKERTQDLKMTESFVHMKNEVVEKFRAI